MPLPVAHALAAMIAASAGVDGVTPIDTTLEGDDIVVAQILRYPGKVAFAQPKTEGGKTPLHLTSSSCEVVPGHDYVPMTRDGSFAIFPDPDEVGPGRYCLLEREVFNHLLERKPYQPQEVPDDAS